MQKISGAYLNEALKYDINNHNIYKFRIEHNLSEKSEVTENLFSDSTKLYQNVVPGSKYYGFACYQYVGTYFRYNDAKSGIGKWQIDWDFARKVFSAGIHWESVSAPKYNWPLSVLDNFVLNLKHEVQTRFQENGIPISVNTSGIPDKCFVCSKEGKLKRCASCKIATYCSIDCQKKDWPTHKQICKKN